jgi:hypothetical protein
MFTELDMASQILGPQTIALRVLQERERAVPRHAMLFQRPTIPIAFMRTMETSQTVNQAEEATMRLR